LYAFSLSGGIFCGAGSDCGVGAIVCMVCLICWSLKVPDRCRICVVVAVTVQMIISMIATKGGCGKTTSALALAYYFSTRRPKYQTVLVDGDPNRTAIDWYAASDVTIPFQVVSAEEEWPPAQIHIVDTAARTSEDELAELVEVSDLIIIPSKLNIFDIRTAIAFAETFRKTPDRYRILLTGLPARGSKLYNEAKSLFDDEGLMTFDGGIRHLAVYRDADFDSVPVAQFGRAGKAAFKDYEVIGKQITKGWL
jgi:chromosome partitioning protein